MCHVYWIPRYSTSRTTSPLWINRIFSVDLTMIKFIKKIESGSTNIVLKGKELPSSVQNIFAINIESELKNCIDISSAADARISPEVGVQISY